MNNQITEQMPVSTVPCGMVSIGGRVADLGQRVVRSGAGHAIELSERETALLSYMADHAGRVVTRDEILQQVWQLNPRRIITRTIDMHVAHLRAKLGDDAQQPKLLRTVRGQGYLLTVDPLTVAA